MTDRFVTLHRHDAFSFFDGVDVATRAVDRAVVMGQPALALTNHGVPFGLIDHYKAATEKGIKPILGCEMYVTLTDEKPDKEKPLTRLNHMTVLVENAVGYQNLMRLLSLGNSDTYFFRKARVPVERLYEHKDGLLFLSGCPQSVLNLVLREQGHEAFRELFARMASELNGRFWGEVQHKAEFSEFYRAVFEASRTNGVPVVATTDAHYVEAADKQTHDFLLSLRKYSREKGVDKGEEAPTYGYGYHLMTRKEMEAQLAKGNPWMKDALIEESLEETLEIADRVNFEPVKPEQMLPPLWQDAIPRLRALAADGMKRRNLGGREYEERLARELRVVEMKGYAEYFHICQEVTSWARDRNIMIGPRGSVCGSLLAYVLGITTVDPLVHGTLFERFLHETKKSFPDVDLDIEDRHRTEVLKHVITTYAPYAIPIITFGKMALGLANNLHEVLGDKLTDGDYRNLRWAFSEIKWARVPFLTDDEIAKRKIFATVEAKVPGITRVIKKMYGSPYYVGQHPGGVCFVPGDHTAWIAKVRAKDKLQTSYDFRDCEYLGLLKFDFLGLAAMSAVNDSFEMISKRTGETVAVDRIPLNDADVIGEFAAGHTDGVFQFETPGAREILMKIAPLDFAEVAVANALNRPGVSGNLDKYVAGKASGVSDGVFSDTHGVVVYQEQVMKMLMGLDFTLDECDKFLKTIKAAVRTVEGQQALQNPLHKKLVEALVARGKNRKEAEDFTFDTTQYAFNKAHAVGYTLVAYWMMWLRQHHPQEFWCALLNSEPFDNRRAIYEGCAVRAGVLLHPPHVNGSVGYSIEGNAIRVGLNTLEAIGPLTAPKIINSGPYKKPSDLSRLPRRTLNMRVASVLSTSGALIFPMDSPAYVANMERYNVRRKSLGGVVYPKGRAPEETDED